MIYTSSMGKLHGMANAAIPSVNKQVCCLSRWINAFDRETYQKSLWIFAGILNGGCMHF
jgi:hypothetical protein